MGEIEFLQFALLAEEKGIVHGVFLRKGGVSQPPFDSLNVGGGTQDDEEAIGTNRRLILDLLGVKRLVSSYQVHGNTVHWVQGEEDPGSCDGMVTNLTQTALLTKHADCQAAVFYDPINCAIASVHAGWRGNVANIYATTVDKMKGAFGTKPENLLVGISPSLGPNHAEFKNYKLEFPENFWGYEIKTRPTYFDLWQLAQDQLEEAGVLPHHIEMASLCTYAEENDFFSYRREGKTGRHGTLIALV